MRNEKSALGQKLTIRKKYYSNHIFLQLCVCENSSLIHYNVAGISGWFGQNWWFFNKNLFSWAVHFISTHTLWWAIHRVIPSCLGTFTTLGISCLLFHLTHAFHISCPWRYSLSGYVQTSEEKMQRVNFLCIYTSVFTYVYALCSKNYDDWNPTYLRIPVPVYFNTSKKRNWYIMSPMKIPKQPFHNFCMKFNISKQHRRRNFNVSRLREGRKRSGKFTSHPDYTFFKTLNSEALSETVVCR